LELETRTSILALFFTVPVQRASIKLDGRKEEKTTMHKT